MFRLTQHMKCNVMTIICVLLSNYLEVLLCVLSRELCVITVPMSLHQIKADLLVLIRVWPLKVGHNKQEWSFFLQLSHVFCVVVFFCLFFVFFVIAVFVIF